MTFCPAKKAKIVITMMFLIYTKTVLLKKIISIEKYYMIEIISFQIILVLGKMLKEFLVVRNVQKEINIITFIIVIYIL